MESDLLGCPFCGGSPECHIGWAPDGEGGEIEVFIVLCPDCYAQMQDGTERKADVIANWNKRITNGNQQ